MATIIDTVLISDTFNSWREKLNIIIARMNGLGDKDDINIDGGNIDGALIGNSIPAAGTFTECYVQNTLDARGSAILLDNNSLSGNYIVGGTAELDYLELSETPTEDYHAITKSYLNNLLHLNNLNDTTIESISNNNFLVYKSSTSSWENQSAAEVIENLELNDIALSAGIHGLTSGTITASDEIAYVDVDDGNIVKKDTVQGLLDLVPAVNDATTTEKGIVEKATEAEMTAGTADKFPDANEVKTYTDLKLAKASNLSDVDNASTAFNNIKQNATTSATGVVEEATQTEMESGSNGKFPDCATVRNVLLGWGQTWQDVTASRALNTVYTNTTGKPIMVSIDTPSGSKFQVSSDGTTWIELCENADFGTAYIIPDDYRYKVVIASGAIVIWAELR